MNIRYSSYYLAGLLVAITISLGNHTHCTLRVLSQKQACAYARHIFDTLFIPSLQDKNHAEELHALERVLLYDIVNKSKAQGVGPAEYKADAVYKLVLDKAIAFIGQQSIQYAQKELSNVLADKNKKRQLIGLVSRTIKEKIEELISGSKVLEPGLFRYFVGTALRAKVRRIIQENTI